MSQCTVCGEPLSDGAKSCPVCGTTVAPSPSASSAAGPEATVPFAGDIGPGSSSATTYPPTEAASGGERQCPECGKRYGADYADSFCDCGAELVPAESSSGPPASLDADDEDALVIDASEAERANDLLSPPTAVPDYGTHAASPANVFGSEPSRPSAGTICLVVYSAEKKPIRYHALLADVTLIGRADPIRGDFPDIDLAELFDEETAKRVSRKHALILRSRQDGSYSLRPLAKNTGTQIEKEMATELVDYPLSDGTRLVLGGVVRLKFEVMK